MLYSCFGRDILFIAEHSMLKWKQFLSQAMLSQIVQRQDVVLPEICSMSVIDRGVSIMVLCWTMQQPKTLQILL